MSLLVPSSSKTHEPLPSLPPSPTEEDLGGAASWREVDSGDEQEVRSPSSTSSNKGKGRAQVAEHDDMGSASPPQSEGVYPPTAEDEAEERRVAETLKRWEQSERQRRKAARDSAASSTPSSVVESMTKRASYLWSGRSTQPAVSNGAAFHTALRQNSDDALPLSELGAPSPGASKPPSPVPPSPPSPSAGADPSRGEHTENANDNPFEPPNSATPLRTFNLESTSNAEDSRRDSSEPSTPTTAKGVAVSPFDDPATPRQQRTNVPDSRYPKHSPPRPIDIPPPKTPPPRVHTPHSSMSPGPKGNAMWTQPASTSQQSQSTEPEHRWWTDWLCGCREGGDADDQAGRTNPFE